LLLERAQKVDKAANFVFLRLTEQEPGRYDKCHADCAKQDKTDLVWEKNLS
jgi:hypothetical protein